jgi:hypothetical protein
MKKAAIHLHHQRSGVSYHTSKDNEGRGGSGKSFDIRHLGPIINRTCDTVCSNLISDLVTRLKLLDQIWYTMGNMILFWSYRSYRRVGSGPGGQAKPRPPALHPPCGEEAVEGPSGDNIGSSIQMCMSCWH